MTLLKENRIPTLIIIFFSLIEILWVISYFVGLSLNQYAVIVTIYLVAFGGWVIWADLLTFRGSIFSFRNLWVFFRQKGWILGLSAVLILTYLFVNRPDGDDEIFLKMQIMPMLAPNMAITDIPDVHASGRMLENFEIFQATISSTLKVPFLLVYYTVFPSIFLVLLPMVWRDLFACWGLKKKNIFYTLVFCLFLMITWADTHRAPANFGVVRLYQGKAVYCSLIIPVQYLAMMSFQRNRRFSDALIAALSFYAGIFFTPTAIPCSALMYGVTALIDLRWDWRKAFKASFSYLLMISGPLILAFLITSNFEFESTLRRTKGDLHGYYETIQHREENPKAYQAGIFDRRLLNTEVLRFTYGWGLKTCFAVASMIYVVFRTKSRFLQWYTIIFLGMLLVPVMSDLFSRIYGSFSWRWLWCYPIIPVVAWSAMDALSHIWRRNTFAAIGISILLLIAYTITGRTIFYRSNGSHGTRIEFSPIKLFEGKDLRYDWAPVVEDHWLIYDDHKL